MEPIFILSEDKMAGLILLEAELTGDAEACRQAGLLFIDGSGVSVDFEKAKHWLTMAVNKGSAEAVNDLAKLNCI